MGQNRGSKARGLWARVGRIKNGICDGIGWGLGEYSKYVIAYPWWFIIGTVLLTGALSVGFWFRATEYEMNRLYSLSGTTSEDSENNYKSWFGRERQTMIGITSDENLLRKDWLKEIYELHRQVKELRIRTEDIAYDEYGHKLEHLPPQLKQVDEMGNETWIAMPESLGYEDLCVRDGWQNCSDASIFDLYFSKTTWGNPLISRKWPIIPSLRSGKIYRIDAMIGGFTVKKDQQGSRDIYVVEATTTMTMSYRLKGEGGWEHFSAEWERQAQALAMGAEPRKNYEISIKTQRSLEDELRRMSQMSLNDFFRLLACGLLLCLYCIISNFSRTTRHKIVPGLFGVAAATLGYLSGGGLAYLLGVKHTPPCEATPFLVLGIGIDDMFVLINAYSLTYPYDGDYKARIVMAVQDAGLSITVTTITNIAAFIIGAISPYFSISMFCIITALALLFGYLYCLTFFLAWLCIDAKREAHGKLWYRWHYHPTSSKESHALPSTELDSSPEIPNSPTTPRLGLPLSPLDTFAVNPVILENIDLSEIWDDYKRSHPHSFSDITLSHQLPTLPISGADHITPSAAALNEAFTVFELIAYLEWAYGGTQPARDTALTLPRPPSEHSDSSGERTSPLAASAALATVTQSLPEKPTKRWWPEPPGNIGRISRKFTLRWYKKYLGSIWSKILAILAVTAYIAAVIHGAQRIQSGIGFREITPDDSYLRRFYDIAETYYNGYGEEVVAFWPYQMDYSLPGARKAIEALDDRLAEQEIAGLSINGMSYFYNAHPESESLAEHGEFEKQLWLWINFDTFGRNFYRDFHFVIDPASDSYTLLRWKFHYWMPYIDNSMELYDRHLSGREAVREAGMLIEAAQPVPLLAPGDEPVADVYTHLAVVWESDPYILPYTVKSLLIALATIGGISLILLKNLESFVIVMATIVSIDAGILGFMHYVDLKLNLLTMVTLLVSVGYSVDFTLHFVHTYTHCASSKSYPNHNHVAQMVAHIGPPVTHGMFSSLIAILILSTSPKYALYVFFQMLSAVLVLAYLHGVILIPFLLQVKHGLVATWARFSAWAWPVDASSKTAATHLPAASSRRSVVAIESPESV